MFIESLTKEKVRETLNLVDRCLGKDYMSENTLTNTLKANEYFCKVIIRDLRVIGVCYYYVVDKNVVLKTICIDSDYKNRGLGYELIKTCISPYLQTKGYTISCIAWKSKTGTNIHSLMMKLGFKKTTEIENYWYEDSVKLNFSCTSCGNPCNCSAVIYEINNALDL